jgi:4'-phosphopantetheinyl transferase EntD
MSRRELNVMIDEKASDELSLLCEWTRSVFARAAVVEGSLIQLSKCGTLFPEESCLIGSAVAARKREFETGRNCARRALRRLDIEPCPILMGAMREPLWPENIIGSITHEGSYCIVALQRPGFSRGMGIDLTQNLPLHNRIVSAVCAPEERQLVAPDSLLSEMFDPRRVVFSMKESLYKCLYPTVKRVFEFRDVRIELDRHAKIGVIHLLRSELVRAVQDVFLYARYFATRNHIITSVWMEERM